MTRLAYLLGLLLITLTAPAQSQSRPHIILFIGDDLSWHDVGPYSAKDVRTPHLDRLATESLTFEYAFAASPTCSPSRHAMYTGLYPFRNGGHSNHSQIKPELKTLPHYFKELGYRVAIAGKTHVGPRSAFPFEFLRDTNNDGGALQEKSFDLETAGVDRLLAGHDKTQPLFLLVCAHQPHVAWPPNDGYDPKSISMPPYFADTPELRELRARYYTDVTWMDRQVGQVLASLDQHAYPKQQTLFIFTTDQGTQWPMGKWNVYDAGLRVPLMIRWSGRVKPGTRTEALVSLIDLLPTLLEAAGGKAPNNIDGRSFLPVIRGESQHHHDHVFASHTGDKQFNRSPMRAIRTKQYKYVHNLLPDARYTTHISDVETKPSRSAWPSVEERAKTDPKVAEHIRRYRNRPQEELFDVLADPYELNNLATDPKYATVLADLREKLKAWRLQQGEDLTKVPMPEDAVLGGFPYAN